jgi:hypothetical protein
MKRMVFFITLAFILSASLVIMPVHVYAQRNITVINPGFEKPDSGKIEGFEGKTTHTGTGFKVLVVPGWHVDAPDSSVFDSGVEPATNMTGKYRAYLMGGDSGIFQITNRRLADGEQLKLTVDAFNNWKGTSLKMALFYREGDTANGVRQIVASDVKTLTNKTAPYSITLSAADAPLAVGMKIGILLDNVSPDSASWLNIDNIQLTNEDSTIIEVTNYSFELPDSGKIKGWDGPGSCKDLGWTYPSAMGDIPGWTCDSLVQDSGIEYNSDGGDGQYASFMRWDDNPVWNTTDYTILAGDEITLKINGRASWLSDMIHYELYYNDAGTRTTLVSDDALIDPTGATWGEYSIGFAANTTPACIGKNIGVLIKNSSLIASSWAAVDLVRINANHKVTAVYGTQIKPSAFSLKQNYPNPFNPTTNISYTLKSNGKVRLAVFDILGREVAVLANETQTAGQHVVTFSANNLSSGIYFYKLQAASEVITKKMVLLK